MYNDIEEWINTQHMTVEEVLEELTEDTFFNLMISETIREDALDNKLTKFQQRLQQFNVDADQLGDPQDTGEEIFPDTELQNTLQQNPQSNELQPADQTPEDQNAFDFNTTPKVDTNLDNADTPNFNLDDANMNDVDFTNNNKQSDTDDTQNASDLNSEQNIEDQKDKLISNIKQLMELRDLLDEVISTTTDPYLLKINQQINKLLSTIANIGDSIMDRPDIAEINNDLEQFLTDAVVETKKKIEQIRNKNKR